MAWTSQLRVLPAATLTACCLVVLPASAQAMQTAPGATLEGDTEHPSGAHGWLETRLFFGLGPVGKAHAGVTEAAWLRFLDTEVTPRFPDGLSIIDVYGQWLGKLDRLQHHSTPARIRSKMLLIDYPATPDNVAKIDAIRTAWKRQTGDQSVLKVTQPVDISF